MTDAQFHRGPDAEGVKLLGERTTRVGLGHRRLSIIDLVGGRQPMSNEDGTVWITYNGEVYNHLELREELIERGHRYRTRCDTETIIHAYEEWGTACVQRFRGMFAFAIWDDRKEQLFAARDRMGVKPFYYVDSERTLACASEIKALLASEWVTPELNVDALPEHLALGYLAGASTLFRSVKKLMPGHWLLWKDGKLTIDQYWDVPMPGNSMPAGRTQTEYVDEFLSIFQESVRLRLMSDVSLGVFLSGGLDSSAIAATMAQQMSEPVKTFSVGFEADYYSEFDFAREVARAIGADHHEVVLRPGELFSTLPRLIWHEDEPIRNASSVALHAVSSLAQEKVKVVLTGEGSDELFAGYERYWASLFNMRWGALYHGIVPTALHDSYVRDQIWRWPLPLSVKKKLSHTFFNHSLSPEELVFDNWYAVLPRHVRSQILSARVRDSVGAVDPYCETMRFYAQRPDGNPLDRLLYTDQKTYLVELLMKQDAMSMATSIESRVPFLDHHLVEFAARVPGRFKVRRMTAGKHLIKKAMHRVLPESVIMRKKMGFPVPLRAFFRRGFDELVRTVLLSESSRHRGVFNLATVEQLLTEHDRGFRDHTDALWTVLNFELWARIFLDHKGFGPVTEELLATEEKVSCGLVKAVA